jgi:hypothetical protein
MATDRRSGMTVGWLKSILSDLPDDAGVWAHVGEPNALFDWGISEWIYDQRVGQLILFVDHEDEADMIMKEGR